MLGHILQSAIEQFVAVSFKAWLNEVDVPEQVWVLDNGFAVVLLPRWAFSSFPSTCQPWLITTVRALHRLMRLPRPPLLGTPADSQAGPRPLAGSRLRNGRLLYGTAPGQRENIGKLLPDFHQIKSFPQR